MRSLHVVNGVRLGVVLGSVVILAVSVSAAEDESQPQPTVPAPSIVPSSAPATAAAKPKTSEVEVRAQLDGTRWSLQVTPLSGGEKVKSQKDTVTFDTKQISSERLSKAGFPTSNYTLTVGDDGVAVWETMQTKEGEGVAFWRGELHGSTMRGVLSKHPAEGNPEDFSFTGQETSGKTIAMSGTSQSTTEVSGTSSTPASAGQTQATTASTEAPKKKRKGLFGR